MSSADSVVMTERRSVTVLIRVRQPEKFGCMSIKALDARVVSRAADDRASDAFSSVDRCERLRRMALEQDEMLRFRVRFQ